MIVNHVWAPNKQTWAKPNPSQEGYYNSINPLVEGVPHIFTGLKYSGASKVSHTSFPVVQFIGQHYTVYFCVLYEL